MRLLEGAACDCLSLLGLENFQSEVSHHREHVTRQAVIFHYAAATSRIACIRHLRSPWKRATHRTFKNMSLAALDQSSLASICVLVDARYVARLLCSGSPLLISKLRRSVRDFDFKLENEEWPHRSLFELARQFTQAPRSFAFSLTRFSQDSHPGVDTEVDWEPWFSSELHSFSFKLGGVRDSLPLFGTHFPALRTLVLAGLEDFTPTKLAAFPQTLTSLRIDDFPRHGFCTNVRLLEFLPPNLTQLRCGGTTLVPNGSPKVDLSHLPLVDVRLYLSLKDDPIDFDWTFLPSSVKILEVKVQNYESETVFVPPNSSWKQLFPDLTRLDTRVRSLFPKSNPEQAIIDFPQTLTAFNFERAYDYTDELFESALEHMVAPKNGHAIVEIGNTIPEVTKLLHFPCLEHYDLSSLPSWYQADDASTSSDLSGSMAESRCRAHTTYIDRITSFQRATTLLIPFLPLPEQLRLFPKTLTSMQMQVTLERKDPSLPTSAVDPSSALECLLFAPSDWPPLLESLSIQLNWNEDGDASQVLPSFNFSGLPTSLTHLKLDSCNVRVPQENRRLGRIQEKSPFFKGSLAHLTRLRTLLLNVNGKDYRKAIDSRLDLPASLTNVDRRDNGMVPDDFLMSPADAPDQHHLVNLTKLRMISVPLELPRISSVDKNYLQLMRDYDRSVQDQGLDITQYHRLPRNLKTLTCYAKRTSAKWNESVFASLPRDLTELTIKRSGALEFEDDGACLHALPPTLTSFDFGSTETTEIEVPEWFYWYLPESITRINKEDREPYPEEEEANEEEAAEEEAQEYKKVQIVE